MKGFKRCTNGHFYKETLADCPHCANGSVNSGQNSELDKTAFNQDGNSDFNKTQLFGPGSSSMDGATQVAHGNNATQVFGAGNAGASPTRDFNKTYIGGISDDDGSANGPISAPRAARMITGWLVSFTLDPMGVDYRIYEGNNTIGRDPSNSISITSDHTISGRHANILHKKGQFWIKDEMAANGTFVNGTEIEIEKAFAIKDGDEIKLGDTAFIFKTWH